MLRCFSSALPPVLSSLSSFMFSQRTNWKLSPNRFTQALEAMRASGTTLLDLSVSNPTECGLQYDSAAILAAFQNSNSLSYDPQPKGLLSAREEVARYYLRDHHVSVHPESIILTTSTSEAYSYIFRLLCNPQDEILVPKPSYPLFDFLADLQDVTLVPYSLEYAHGWMVDFQSITRALTPRTRAILLVHPNNPTGSYLRAEEVQHLNDLCQEHNLALIVDEVFLDYSFAGIAPRTFTANLDALTFTLSGLSKIAALPQMKVAWLAHDRPRFSRSPRARPPRSHRRHLSFAERADAMGSPCVVRPAPLSSAATATARPRESREPPEIDFLATRLRIARCRRWLVCGVARSCAWLR